VKDAFLQVAEHAKMQLPKAIVDLHSSCGHAKYTGVAQVERGQGAIVRVLLWLAGFPKSGRNQPVIFEIQPAKDGVIWRRQFGPHVTSSHVAPNSECTRVIEKMGHAKFLMSLQQSGEGLRIHIEGLRVFGLPCPPFLLPKSETREFASDQGAFCFDVSASLPLLGRLIRYRGTLDRQE